MVFWTVKHLQDGDGAATLLNRPLSLFIYLSLSLPSSLTLSLSPFYAIHLNQSHANETSQRSSSRYFSNVSSHVNLEMNPWTLAESWLVKLVKPSQSAPKERKRRKKYKRVQLFVLAMRKCNQFTRQLQLSGPIAAKAWLQLRPLSLQSRLVRWHPNSWKKFRMGVFKMDVLRLLSGSSVKVKSIEQSRSSEAGWSP